MHSVFLILLLLVVGATATADQQKKHSSGQSLRRRLLQQPLNEGEDADFSSAKAQEVLSLTTYPKLYDYYECAKVFSKERPIHSQDTWRKVRELFKTKFVSEKNRATYDPSKNGFSVPYEVKQTADGKGRGIFATQDVAKGQRIWDTRSTAIFDATGTEYKKFLFTLDEDFDDEFVCDALRCSYMQKDQHDETNWHIAVDLDEGCFCNDGNYNHGINKGCDEDAAKDLPGGCTSNYFALRHVEAGDEFLCDYSEFDFEWNQFYFVELE